MFDLNTPIYTMFIDFQLMIVLIYEATTYIFNHYREKTDFFGMYKRFIIYNINVSTNILNK